MPQTFENHALRSRVASAPGGLYLLSDRGTSRGAPTHEDRRQNAPL